MRTAFVAALVLASTANAASYSSLQLSARSVVLDPARHVGQIAMNSLDARDLIFDLQAVNWMQRGDADTFTPTSDLAIAPSVYDVQPFRRVLVRVGLREKPPDLNEERAFQIRFREVLPAGSHDTARTLTAAVFLAPAQTTGEVRYELKRMGERDAQLIVTDDSNVHAYLGKIRIESGGQEVYEGQLDAFVLASNARSFPLHLSHALQPGEAALSIENDENFSTTVDVPVR